MLESVQSTLIFKDLDLKHLILLEPLFEYYTCPPGTIVFEQGEPADYLYLILHGLMTIRYKPYDGPSITITHLRSGDVFGWSAVIGNPSYTSTLISKGKMEAYRINGSDLRKLCRKYPDTGQIILDKLAYVVSKRWKDARTQVKALLDGGISESNDKLPKKGIRR